MNIKEIVPETNGTLPHYVVTAVPLTFLTIWIVIAFQSKHLFRERRPSLLMRLMWPLIIIRGMTGSKKKEDEIPLRGFTFG
jgi:hypothetical protein